MPIKTPVEYRFNNSCGLPAEYKSGLGICAVVYAVKPHSQVSLFYSALHRNSDLDFIILPFISEQY